MTYTTKNVIRVNICTFYPAETNQRYDQDAAERILFRSHNLHKTQHWHYTYVQDMKDNCKVLKFFKKKRVNAFYGFIRTVNIYVLLKIGTLRNDAIAGLITAKCSRQAPGAYQSRTDSPDNPPRSCVSDRSRLSSTALGHLRHYSALLRNLLRDQLRHF